MSFTCSVPEIDRWFKRCKGKHDRFAHRVTSVHFEDQSQIIGFYAMSMRLEEERMLSAPEKRSWRDRFNVLSNNTFICLNLDYVAVRRDLQGRGIGTIIMGKVISDFATVASTCGVEIMTGSAISEERCRYYESLGFMRYGYARHQPQIFLPALAAIEIVGSAGAS